MMLERLMRIVIPILLITVVLDTALALLGSWLARDLANAASEGDGDDDANTTGSETNRAGPHT
jgi:hypothetical protein